MAVEQAVVAGAVAAEVETVAAEPALAAVAEPEVVGAAAAGRVVGAVARAVSPAEGAAARGVAQEADRVAAACTAIRTPTTHMLSRAF